MTPNNTIATLEYGIVCDDVRREDNGKLIAVGIYASDIQVSRFPTAIQLRLLLGIRSYKSGSFMFNIRVLQDRKTIFHATGSAENTESNSFTVMGTGPIGINVTDDTILKFQGRVDQSRYKTLCTLPVRLKDS